MLSRLVETALRELTSKPDSAEKTEMERILNAQRAASVYIKSVSDLRALILTEKTPGTGDAVLFKTLLDDLFPPPPEAVRPEGTTLTSIFGGAFVAVLIVMLFGLLAVFALDEDRLKQLGNPNTARGLITFLVTLGTVGVAIVLVGGLFLSRRDVIQPRLDYGIQILTALIAVLGTIVGYYYGLNASNPVERDPTTVNGEEVPGGGANTDADAAPPDAGGGTNTTQ